MAWAPDYASLADVRSYLRIQDTDDDVQIALAISAASRAIDLAANRQFGLVDSPEDRYYTARWDATRRQYVVEIDDVMIVTGAAVVGDYGDYSWGTSLTSYDFMPRNAPAKGRPYTEIWFRTTGSTLPVTLEDGVRVTARWGWSAVPDTIELATRLQVARLHARRDAPFGVAGSPEQGSELRLLDRLDPDVAQMIRAYYRWWGAR